MPRDFDSDDHEASLEFTENVECPQCGCIFEGRFFDFQQSLSVQDMTEPPMGAHECPECEWEWGSEMTGWMLYSEAG